MNATAQTAAKSFTINFKVTLCFYGKAFPFYRTIEGEFYGFKTKGAAKRHLTLSLKHFRADGRINEHMRFFHE